MDKILITVIDTKKQQQIRTVPNKNLLYTLQEEGVLIPSICGFAGTCGKCKIKLMAGFMAITPEDRAFFSEEALLAGYRLSCKAYPMTDIKISISEAGEENFSVVTEHQPLEIDAYGIHISEVEIERNNHSFMKKIKQGQTNVSLSLKALKEGAEIANGGYDRAFVTWDDGQILKITSQKNRLYGIAVDLGTTTIAMALVDLLNGNIIKHYAAVNAQRKYGGDVLSRISYANEGGLLALSQDIRRQIAKGILELCQEYGITKQQLVKIAIAGNTSMLHFLLSLCCKSLGMYPFMPITLDFLSFEYNALFPGDFDCIVDLLPGISAFVGADITAGLFFTGMCRQEGTSLFIDIGTNGEIALWNNGELFSTATAAGPAFEGGNIKCGIGCVPGAITQVNYEDGRFKLGTINHQPPIGICAAGVIDLIYTMLKHHLIDAAGKFTKDVAQKELVLYEDMTGNQIVFTQKDVRELQLAKSAIRSGIEVLLSMAKVQYSQVDRFYIAGGFSKGLNLSSAAGIGLFPEELMKKAVPMGNTCLGGTIRHLIEKDSRSALIEIAEKANELNLSDDETFHALFLSHLNF